VLSFLHELIFEVVVLRTVGILVVTGIELHLFSVLADVSVGATGYYSRRGWVVDLFAVHCGDAVALAVESCGGESGSKAGFGA